MTTEPVLSAEITSSFPEWARKLAELYFSGTTSAFVLHGNTYDYVRGPAGEKDPSRRSEDAKADLSRRSEDAKADHYAGLSEFLAEQVFGRWSLVLHYDLGRGLRVAAGRDEQRL